MTRATLTLTHLARLGFVELDWAHDALEGLPSGLADSFSVSADSDLALRGVLTLHERAPEMLARVLDDADARRRLLLLAGASEGLFDFLVRHPEQLDALLDPLTELLSLEQARAVIVSATDGLVGEDGWNALRLAYRRELVRLAAWDLDQEDALSVVDRVAASLADLAGAALDASLAVARRSPRFPSEQIELTRLAIIGMGKSGARELNYLSDVDVIFVGESVDSEQLADGRAVEIATFLAAETMRGIQDLALEPMLWEVDANLRPEGKDGALVRTVESHLAYYERWAKNWEFQALLKARPLAGDPGLGERYLDCIRPLVWTSASRDGFVESVQKMRERVTAHIPRDEVDVQLKLGPGGLRDIEFTVQLLQLVHGANDDQVRDRSTLGALRELSERGYIGRVEAAEFSRDYRFLRVVEHRIQLSRLRRTHLMPRDEGVLRVLARAAGLGTSAKDLLSQWQKIKTSVRSLHERLFYRPLLEAVASLPDEGTSLTSKQATARLAAIGFVDPEGALRHIAALSGGVSRRAAIQRTLLPVMLQWFSDGADPDYGLLTFRNLSEQLGEAYWYLRMLRDSSGAAERLTHALSSSRFIGGLFERIPEAAAWLEKDEELRPRPREALREESAAIVSRHRDDVEGAKSALHIARRREVLRLALAGVLGVISVEELGRALSDVTDAILTGMLGVAHRYGDGIQFAIIAMGRYGGQELGFSSDADIVYVYRPAGIEPEEAQKRAEGIVRELSQLSQDLRLPLDLDIDLRPEGKNGPVVRSLDSYRKYYERWSLTWEAQALLRARGAVGDPELIAEFEALADEVRYPEQISDADVREVKRIKARVEAERLPQGADPARHLKLGRGSLSDVEWFVQLLQLQHAARVPELRTTSTLGALSAAVEAELVTASDAARLREAWIIASRARSAMTLWTAKTADVLPSDRRSLEGVARLMEYPRYSASQLEEDYLRLTRLARQVFERGFYGIE